MSSKLQPCKHCLYPTVFEYATYCDENDMDIYVGRCEACSQTSKRFVAPGTEPETNIKEDTTMSLNTNAMVKLPL